ncbi:MAG TPA: nuclear transport factor 2 family protein [Steroidobacteraceae bacterium]|nr:nuclear transport factor 2 family protein [Steroidobacteraceae bacterium]
MNRLSWLCAVLALFFAAIAQAASDVETAARDLYVRLAQKDLAGLSRYVPQGGFTEFNPDGNELKTMTREYFKAAFASGVQIDFHIEQLQVSQLRKAAIVTGYRVGGLTFPDGKRISSRDCLTMVWSLQSKVWLLQHVHLSQCEH